MSRRKKPPKVTWSPDEPSTLYRLIQVQGDQIEKLRAELVNVRRDIVSIAGIRLEDIAKALGLR